MPGAKDKVVEGLSIFQLRPLGNVNVKSSLGHKSVKGVWKYGQKCPKGVHNLHWSKATYVQSGDVTRFQSATEWTASVHTQHMFKANVTTVQSVTEWTAWYILYTCPKQHPQGIAWSFVVLKSGKKRVVPTLYN